MRVVRMYGQRTYMPPNQKANMELQPLISQMTGWQRSQFARAGYPQDSKFIKALLKRQHGVFPKSRKRKSIAADQA